MPHFDGAARRFLKLLAACEPGNVVVANMAAARAAGHWTLQQCRDFLEHCIDQHVDDSSTDGKHAYEALARAIGARHRDWFFSRALTAGLDSPIALVIPYANLFPSPPDLDLWEAQNRLIFRRRYIEGVLRQGGAEDAVNHPRQAMQDVLEGFERHLASNAQLGRNQYVVFVTRADEVWDAHVAHVPPQGDELRDRLGIPYRAGTFLIGLRSDQSLAHLAAADIKIAAPTVIEAWRCEFFRQVPDLADRWAWGQTVHLRLLSEGTGNIDGAPEAIIQMLPITKLRQHIRLMHAGTIGETSAATMAMHWRRLLDGRTVDQIISAVLAP